MSRKLFDQERKRRRKTEEENNHLKVQISHATDIMNSYGNRPLQKLNDKFDVLPSNPLTGFSKKACRDDPQLSAIHEGNTTGSLLSEFSYSRSEDDLDVSLIGNKSWRKHRPSSDFAEPATKKQRSTNGKTVEINQTNTVRATTTVTVLATSVIEAVPSAPFESPERPALAELVHHWSTCYTICGNDYI